MIKNSNPFLFCACLYEYFQFDFSPVNWEWLVHVIYLVVSTFMCLYNYKKRSLSFLVQINIMWNIDENI